MEAIDLGLSVLWADRNLGAITEDDFGDYCGWTYISNNCISLRNFNMNKVIFPNGWRLPSETEFKELLENCTLMHIDNGMIFIGPSGAQILLPYGSFYNNNNTVIPKERNNGGLYLSSSFANAPYSRCLLIGNLLTMHISFRGDFIGEIKWGSYLNLRLVRDKDKS